MARPDYTTTENELEPSVRPPLNASSKPLEATSSAGTKAGRRAPCSHCREMRTEILELQDLLREARDRVHELERCRALDMEDLREATTEIHIHQELLRTKGDALSFQARVLQRHAETMQRLGNRPLSWRFERDAAH